MGALPSEAARAATWVVGGDTGLSSLTIWATMMGVTTPRQTYPYDPGDLGRCLRLLELMPEWRLRLEEMAAVSPEWAALVAHWSALQDCMTDEVGIDWSKGKSAGLTYRLMKKVLQHDY